MNRRFYLKRIQDPTGVSGTGVVATGCYFEEEEVAVIVWRGRHPSVVLRYPTPEAPDVMEAIRAIHGHGGSTEIWWSDAPTI